MEVYAYLLVSSPRQQKEPEETDTNFARGGLG